MKALSTFRILSFLLIAIGSLLSDQAHAQYSTTQARPRIVVTADPELDDNNSLIRFLLYSCDLDIEGLIYASSQFHWKGDGKGTKWFIPGREYNRFGLDTCPCPSWRWAADERFIHTAVEAYAKVYPNLKIHNANYPAPAELMSKIRYGNIEFDGDYSKNSPGSILIKSLILDNKPGKLFITAWGGQSTIARALKDIQDQYEFTADWDNIKRKISRKVVLLPSGDQDDTYATYIKPNWPDIEYRQFHQGPNYSYGAQLRALPEDSLFLTASWIKPNISDRGPLGALYRVWGDGKQMVKGDRMDYFGFSELTDDELRKKGYIVWMPVQPKGSWLGEGDDFTFMNMLGNGLRAYEQGDYGGWGGRQTQSQSTSFNLSDTSQQAMISAISSSGTQVKNAFPNFFPAAQQDFAARMKWSVTPKYADANHAPRISIQGPLHVMAAAGQSIRLNALLSDPDGDEITVIWWQFQTGTYPGKTAIDHATTDKAIVLVPKDATSGQTIHIIVEASDSGTPKMTSYQRIIITVR